MTVAEIEDTVTVTHFRTLVVLDGLGEMNLNDLAGRQAGTAGRCGSPSADKHNRHCNPHARIRQLHASLQRFQLSYGAATCASRHRLSHTVHGSSRTGEAPPTTGDPDLSRQVDAATATARVLLGRIAQPVAQVEDRVNLSQFRVLVLVATHGPLNLSAVAESLGVQARSHYG